MQNALFSTGSETIAVAHILHAGGVHEVPVERRKGDFTHSFKVTTTRGATYCPFKSEEAARKSRGVLGAMMGTIIPHLFRSKGESIAIAGIVSFGKVVPLKKEGEDDVFGFPVTLSTIAEKNATLWLTFSTEESTRNVRKALFAALMSYYGESGNGTSPVETTDETVTQPVEVQG